MSIEFDNGASHDKQPAVASPVEPVVREDLRLLIIDEFFRAYYSCNDIRSVHNLPPVNISEFLEDYKALRKIKSR